MAAIVQFEAVISYKTHSETKLFRNIKDLQDYMSPLLGNPDSDYTGHIIYQITRQRVETAGVQYYESEA